MSARTSASAATLLAEKCVDGLEANDETLTRHAESTPAIATALARHEELASLREEAESLAEALAARKAIERAKGLLMAREGLSEEDAFKRLRKASQLSGKPLKVVAEALIALDA